MDNGILNKHCAIILMISFNFYSHFLINYCICAHVFSDVLITFDFTRFVNLRYVGRVRSDHSDAVQEPAGAPLRRRGLHPEARGRGRRGLSRIEH